jgi:hypothetical protein
MVQQFDLAIPVSHYGVLFIIAIANALPSHAEPSWLELEYRTRTDQPVLNRRFDIGV